MLAIERAFHGRTDRPAQISHSCKDGYDKNLNTFQGRENLALIPANDIAALQAAFARPMQTVCSSNCLPLSPCKARERQASAWSEPSTTRPAV